MARITVEDCIDKIPDRFELVALAAQRARNIISGSQVTVDRDNDKAPVLALREIALGNIKPDSLREEVIRSYQSSSKIETLEEETSIENQEEELTELDEYIQPYIANTVEMEESFEFEDDEISSDQRGF